MEITEVRVKLTEDSDDRLQAFCSITFDDAFVVRDLKIIEGTNGPFVAMPSRKLTSHCLKCGSKNHLRANYCNQCGSRLQPDKVARSPEGRIKLYADIAHPINSICREMIQQRVIAEYRTEIELSKQPGYVSRYEDDYEDDFTAIDLLDDPRNPQPAEAVREPRAIQPPSSEPRPPHTPAGRPIDPQPAPQRGKSRGEGFGAGIFED
jgi:stage V sporulation protein G